jgi:hypothetical protein
MRALLKRACLRFNPRMRKILPLFALLAALTSHAQDRVFYGPSSDGARFNDVLPLSDGDVLIAGSAATLNWLPQGTPIVPLDAGGLSSSAVNRRAFVLHLNPALDQVIAAYAFPANTVRDVFKLRSTERPGQPTGAIYLSGARDGGSTDGYYLARFNGNGVDAPITGLSFVYSVGAGGDHKERQPWDVSGAGEVFFATGIPFDSSFATIEKLSSTGTRMVVPDWWAHWGTNGEWRGTPASSFPGPGTLGYSGLVMKAARPGSLRSWTQSDFDLTASDGNGNSGRKGKYPDDYYFSGPCPLAGSACTAAPGYTGYRIQGITTQRVGGIAVDRRDGTLYFGYSTKSTLPGGNPDFEPAVVSMAATGALNWWSRLYQETTANSSPDQYVDALAIDYAQNRVVVLARSHGNNTINFWSGNAISAMPGAAGFQNRFSGTNGNIHISWLGAFDLAQPTLRAATWVAEYFDPGEGLGTAHPDPNLMGFPNPNAAWPKLNTTRCGADSGYSGGLKVSRTGEVAVLCVGRRTITTTNAHQKMLLPGAGNSTWNQFVRVYRPDLSGVRYSSLLTGAWTDTGGGDNTQFPGFAFDASARVIAAGFHRATSGIANGNPLPTLNVPAWGRAVATNETPVLARLSAGELLFADGFGR